MSRKDSGSESTTTSNNLWVGNIAMDTTDWELMDLFRQYGALYATSYSSRSFAFVFFKGDEDSTAAKAALQGKIVRGYPLKIEFARRAKPCKHLWVGGISPKVSMEQLEEEFIKFGKIEDFKFLRDRNTAFIEYFRLEDASKAMKNMNGKQIGGDLIHVDFLRSQPSRREQWLDVHDSRDRQFPRSMGPDTHYWTKRQQYSQPSAGQRGEGQPSKVLWICYPPSIQIDEQMLHNAMILFGEIERIKSFPSRNYSFVEFRSVDEARCAKDGLQGRLFNDPRITIMFSSSDIAPGKDYSGFYSGRTGASPEMFFNEHPFQLAHMDMLVQNHPMMSNNFPGPLPSGGVLGPNMPMRPVGPRGSFELPLAGQEYNDFAALSSLPDSNPNNLIGPSWGRPSPPAPGILPSPALGVMPTMRIASGARDVFEANQFQRDSKRSRLDGALSSHDTSFSSRKIDDHGMRLDQSYGRGPVSGAISGGRGQGHIDNDFIWRGIIAKGGTPICHARCVPMGKGMECDLPAVVNCSAKTGLDMLTKLYAGAIGFDIVFFLPDSEEDFDSYTQFLCYLTGNNRAGVVKLDDGTTLFLVAPSDFLTKVLKIMGPERLYGVVVKMPQQIPSSKSMQQEKAHQQYIDRPLISPSQAEYGLARPKEEQVLPMEYNRDLHEESKFPQKQHFPAISESLGMQSIPHDYTSNNTLAVPQAGISFTPELIASLASILPSNTQSGAIGSSTLKPSFHPSVEPNRGTSSEGWKQEDQASEQTDHILQQPGIQFNSQAPPLPQLQPYQPVPAPPSHSENMALGSAQSRDSAINLPQQGAISSRTLPNANIPSHSGQFAISQQLGHHYHPEVPNNTQKSYGMAHGNDASGFYGSAFQKPNESSASSSQVHRANVSQPQNVMPSSVNGSAFQQPNESSASSSQVHGAYVSHPQNVMPSSVENPGVEPTNHVQQLQPSDNYQRYKSTLQLAASLLLKVQQQQTSAPAGGGSANQQ